MPNSISASRRSDSRRRSGECRGAEERPARFIPAQDLPRIVPVAQHDTGAFNPIQHPLVDGGAVGMAVNDAGEIPLAHECVDRLGIDVHDGIGDLTHVGLARLARDPREFTTPCDRL